MFGVSDFGFLIWGPRLLGTGERNPWPGWLRRSLQEVLRLQLRGLRVLGLWGLGFRVSGYGLRKVEGSRFGA